MNTTFRRVLLGLTVAIGLYVGVWAEFFPGAFYSSFPGFGLHWINVDGPYNGHLIRDVGSLYLGLGAASLAAKPVIDIDVIVGSSFADVMIGRIIAALDRST